VGATADRLAGSLDVERALAEGARAFQPGLLAAANRGILYVDEVNLLGDHLVDLLLDAAAMGVHHVEREGVSVRHASRFLLVGTMNPEEGELRPQLLDRFGLVVEVRGCADPAERAEVVRRRLAYEADPEGFARRWREEDERLRGRILRARRLLPAARLPDALLERIVRACASLDADGHRADIVTAKAALALAAWEGRAEVGLDDVRRAAALALPHRRRRGPMEEPGLERAELEAALGDGDPEPPPPAGGGGERAARPGEAAGERDGDPPPAEPSVERAGGRGPVGERVDAPGATFRPALLEVAGRGRGPLGRRSRARDERGRPVGDLPASGPDLALVATVRAAAPHQRARGRVGPGLVLRPEDLRVHLREGREGNLVVFVLDASGSMAARRRMREAKAAVLSLLLDSYQRRDKVALVAFRGEGAEVVLPPTASVEVAAARLRRVPKGGRTPLAAGLALAARILAAEALRDPARRPLVVLVTDGRATGGADPMGEALRAASSLAGLGAPALVVDAEEGPVRLGFARGIARALAAPCVRLEDLRSGGRVVRAGRGAA